jgi:hypothetical protein
VLQLALVVALLERDAGGAQPGETFVVLAERVLEFGQLLPLLLDLLLAPGRFLAQRLDLALPCEMPLSAGSGAWKLTPKRLN